MCDLCGACFGLPQLFLVPEFGRVFSTTLSLSVLLEIIPEHILYMYVYLLHAYSLMVSQVNQYLDDLAMSNTKKDRPGMRKALQLLLRNTSALEQKWLIRIILKVWLPYSMSK